MKPKLRVALAAVVAGTSVFSVLRWLRKTRGGDQSIGFRQLDAVEEADLESFPASDAPSWTLGQDPKA